MNVDGRATCTAFSHSKNGNVDFNPAKRCMLVRIFMYCLTLPGEVKGLVIWQPPFKNYHQMYTIRRYIIYSAGKASLCNLRIHSE
jgi:cytochrome b subunit of formate dehydrogenase